MNDEDNRQGASGSLSAVSDNSVRFFVARASVEEMTETDSEIPAIAQVIKQAGFIPLKTSGEPTKLLVTSWMVHEGKNNNNLVFRAEDFASAAERISAPNILPMDWNHSAVLHKEGVPKAIGVWYSAEAKFDEAAYEGRGAHGILAKGIVWAWAFPEYAQEMLEQQRQRGYIEFSMACIPNQVERGRDQNGPYEVAIEPVFFTLSALDMPPGDPDAKGMIENADALREPEKEWWEQEYPEMAAADGHLELEAAVQVLSGAAKEKTNFPKPGDNKQVSLRSSQWNVFPLREAQDLKDNWPEIWKRGGNVRGNDQFRRLAPVARRGGKVTTATEEYAVRLREAWVARHYEDYQLPGVVAQVKWLAVGSRGLDHMRSVLNEAKERVKARRAARTEEETMENDKDMSQAALEAALEANSVLKAELENAATAKAEYGTRMAELEGALAALTARAEEAELKRDALQAELSAAAQQLAGVSAELETANGKLADIAAEQEKVAVEHRWASRFAELPESYRAAFAKRSEDEQARFKSRWATASDEVWGEFKSDLIVGFADAKISYLKLSQEEGVLPNGSAIETGAKISALLK
jgi:hypothetical protein